VGLIAYTFTNSPRGESATTPRIHGQRFEHPEAATWHTGRTPGSAHEDEQSSPSEHVMENAAW
jgi:hypothetical protein